MVVCIFAKRQVDETGYLNFIDNSMTSLILHSFLDIRATVFFDFKVLFKSNWPANNTKIPGLCK